MPISTTRNKTLGRESFIPEEKCFYLWLNTGSLKKAQQHLAEEGYVNPKTGEPYSDFGIRHAAYRYLLYNHERLRPLMEEAGFEGDDDDWNLYLIHRAITILLYSSKSRFKRWIKDNNFERYEYYYEDAIKDRRGSIRSIWETI